MGAVPQPRPQPQLTRRDKDIQVIKAEIAKGNRDENKLTNAVFYDRHNEWRGKELKNASAALRTEWVNLRNGVVRETLKATPVAPPKPAPPPPLPASCSTAVERAVGKCLDLATRGKLYQDLVKKDGTQKWPYTWFFNNTAEASKYTTVPAPAFAWANTQKCAPGEVNAALQAENEYFKLRAFEPLYKAINRAVNESSLSLARYGQGKIVFSMEKGALHGLLMEEGAKKAVEALVANLSSPTIGVHDHVPLADKLITALGVVHSFMELAEGIHNEKMMGAVGKDADEWRRQKRFEFVTLILAEQIRRKSPASPGASAEWLRFQYNRFQPVFFKWSSAKQRDELFGKWGCNPPTPQTSISPR